MTDSEIMEKWQKEHIQSALKYFPNRKLKVLVIGCNRGEECKLFYDFGVRDIVGVDVIEEIGVKFKSPSVKYIKKTAEDMSYFDDGMFDIVYSFATFEHIGDIESAFNESWRILKTGGIIHVFSSPLWNSPYGNHCENLFHNFPWIHLYASKEELEDICQKYNINFTRAQVEWMQSSNDFNRRSSFDYKHICSKLYGADVFENTICLFDRTELNRLNPKQLQYLKKHYCMDDLLGSWHLFEAKKIHLSGDKVEDRSISPLKKLKEKIKKLKI